MPPHSENLEQEGARIVAFKLVRDGKFQEEGITDILVNQEFGGSELKHSDLSFRPLHFFLTLSLHL
jgi:N-methylhydantoinase B/oxoprolinase/acetone carboxylase alpha subunit